MDDVKLCKDVWANFALFFMTKYAIFLLNPFAAHEALISVMTDFDALAASQGDEMRDHVNAPFDDMKIRDARRPKSSAWQRRCAPWHFTLETDSGKGCGCYEIICRIWMLM